MSVILSAYDSHTWKGITQRIPGEPDEYTVVCSECGIEDPGEEFIPLDFPHCDDMRD